VAEREGFSAAFFKGALSTVLATPCGGPLLVPALTWAVAQPPVITYTSFASVGLGMAFPYLVIGAFPRLVSFLPKPGEWMEIFKQVMGFVLLGTVVFILSYIRIEFVIPTVATMMGLWFGLWMVGRVPIWEDLHKRIRAWAYGTATATVIGLVSFFWLADVMAARLQREVDVVLSQRMSKSSGVQLASAHSETNGTELPWKLYSHVRLSEAIAEGRTVFVDFTADWCATCKLNERTSLNVKETKVFVESNGIVTLKADMTGEAPEADELKQRLGGGPLPFYAVFPASAPDKPIVFDGLLTKSRVLEALKQATGHSSTASSVRPGVVAEGRR
jgi:thiol:disulfide interchange protein DsbD